jgi:hypothetical protein
MSQIYSDDNVNRNILRCVDITELIILSSNQQPLFIHFNIMFEGIEIFSHRIIYPLLLNHLSIHVHIALRRL